MHTETDFPVRIAGPEDEGELLRLCLAMLNEECLRDFNGKPFVINQEKIRATIQKAVQPRRNEPGAGEAWCAVVDASDGIAGSVYLTVQTPYYSDQPYICEHWNWLHPAHRKSLIGRSLAEFSQAMAEEMQLALVGGHVWYGDRESPKMRFFRRMGAKPLGAMYLYTSDVKDEEE